MPAFFRASVFQPIARTREAIVVRGTATSPGTSPNGNNLLLPANTLVTTAVLRNIENIFNPTSTAVLYYGYTDDVALDATGFPLEAGASISIEAGATIYALPASGSVRYAIDNSQE